MHVGHLICRNALVGLAKAFVTRWLPQWKAWMNLPTFTQKAPMRWSPLMCFMEHTNGGTWVHLARNADYLWFALENIIDHTLNDVACNSYLVHVHCVFPMLIFSELAFPLCSKIFLYTLDTDTSSCIGHCATQRTTHFCGGDVLSHMLTYTFFQ